MSIDTPDPLAVPQLPELFNRQVIAYGDSREQGGVIKGLEMAIATLNSQLEVAKNLDTPISLSSEDSITRFGFSARTHNALARADITTVGELVKRSLTQLMNIPMLGKTTLDEIQHGLSKFGLKLSDHA